MDEKLKYSLLRDPSEDISIWTRHEKRLWFVTLMLGTCMLYSTRTSMPLVETVGGKPPMDNKLLKINTNIDKYILYFKKLLPAVAKELNWSKTESGTVLSSFFWGYTVTQVLGGYLSDRIGGQRVIFVSALCWAILTLWMPNILLLPSRQWYYSIPFIVTVRILNGAFQGVHFPAMSSITSQNLSSSERSSFFSLLTSGSALGTLLTGMLGSFVLDYFGWQMAFRIIGLLGIVWALMMRLYAMSSDRNRIINVSVPSRLCANNVNINSSVPWLILFRKPSFWAMVIAHACQNNCFFVLLSWLPTYFHENFPLAKGWVVNMVPWLALPPCIFLGKYLTDYLMARDWSLSTIRKIVQSCCFISQNFALLIMCRTKDFQTALTCMTIVIGGSGFHSSAVMVNPQDLAPTHSGSVFGLMNTFGSIPGFLGVYLAGHILELIQSWSAVFSTAALINSVGWIIFTVFGSAERIV